MDALEELKRTVLALQGEVTRLKSQMGSALLPKLDDNWRWANVGRKELQKNITHELHYYRNLIKNSSFENGTAHWDVTSDMISDEQAFYGTHSLKIEPGDSAEQELTGYITVASYGGGLTRLSFCQKGAGMTVEVFDQTTATIKTASFDASNDWVRRTFVFDPGSATSFGLWVINDSATDPVYVDGFQCEPDLTGKWSSIYYDGPDSAAPTVYACASRSSDQTIPDNTPTSIRWDQSGPAIGSINTGPMVVGGLSPNVEFARDGLYYVQAGVCWDSYDVGYRQLKLTVFGETVAVAHSTAMPVAGFTHQTVSGIFNVRAGHVVTLEGYQNSGIDLNIIAYADEPGSVSALNDSPYLWIVRLAEPFY